jgi:hypothetical protein
MPKPTKLTKPITPDDPLKAVLRQLAASADPLVAEWAREMSRAAAARRREEAARTRKRTKS